MPNGDALNDQLEFKHNLKEMAPDDRLSFIAEQTYALTNKFDELDRKVDHLDTRFDECISGTGNNKKVSALSGGLTGGIAAIIIAIVEYFRSRG